MTHDYDPLWYIFNIAERRLRRRLSDHELGDVWNREPFVMAYTPSEEDCIELVAEHYAELWSLAREEVFHPTQFPDLESMEVEPETEGYGEFCIALVSRSIETLAEHYVDAAMAKNEAEFEALEIEEDNKVFYWHPD